VPHAAAGCQIKLQQQAAQAAAVGCTVRYELSPYHCAFLGANHKFEFTDFFGCTFCSGHSLEAHHDVRLMPNQQLTGNYHWLAAQHEELQLSIDKS